MPPPAPNPAEQPVDDLARGHLAEMLAQPIVPAGQPGEHTVADLNLPTDFMRRVADTSLRAAFEQQFRRVFADRPQTEQGVSAPYADARKSAIRVCRPARPRLSEEAARWRSSLREARPPIRGFRAAILDAADEPWPFDAPHQGVPDSDRRAAEIVAKRLAFDGLVATLVDVIQALGPEFLRSEHPRWVAHLRHLGLPKLREQH